MLNLNEIVAIAVILYLIIAFIVGAIAAISIKRSLRDLDREWLKLSKLDKIFICNLAIAWGYNLVLFAAKFFVGLLRNLKKRKPKNNLCLPHEDTGDS